ncbi:unnamed protein product [Thelazia callipaeda]|uniref:BPL/LPL catalytic domain-containing protein n=1 Tax=Thelazia callipaeda TaxID=103827 RepID=A0A0N5CNN8_THECL|nr:unnamed protein product [Thelazia callipaeda]
MRLFLFQILIFTGNNIALYNRILEIVKAIITYDTHTIAHLSYEAFSKYEWIVENTACLIVADTAHLDDKCWIRLQQYFNNSGKMLFLCQNNLLASITACETSKKTARLLKMAFGERQSKKLGKNFETFLKKTVKSLLKDKKVYQTFHAKDFVGGYKYSVVLSKSEDSPLLLYMENAAQHASALFSDATSEQLLQSGSALIADALSRLSIKISTNSTALSCTPGYFICEYDRMPWDMEVSKGMRFDEPFGSMPKLLLRQIRKHGPLPEASKELLPIEVRTRVDHLPDSFNDEIYFKRLSTRKLGKALLYVPVCETTMKIGKSLVCVMPTEPVVIVARQQINGTGRKGNQWLSPIGCAMFTFNYMLSSESSLCNNVGFIQHILCVAVVDGIRSLQNFPLRIKWPNDIYYGRTCKVGGLIVNATTFNDNIVCVGLNLTNSKPTVCINDLLPPELRIQQEDFIANALNKFQYYMDLYERDGQDAFLKHYYQFWLHSREEIILSDTNEKVVIRGLDRYGYLEVRSRKSGKTMAVHPDDNTFDMMKGLIIAKYV